MDIEDSEAHSSHENAPKSLSFKQAYHFFTQSKNSQNAIEQKTFESKIESVMSIKFPAQTQRCLSCTKKTSFRSIKNE